VSYLQLLQQSESCKRAEHILDQAAGILCEGDPETSTPAEQAAIETLRSKSSHYRKAAQRLMRQAWQESDAPTQAVRDLLRSVDQTRE
jgi:hypothetical protein